MFYYEETIVKSDTKEQFNKVEGALKSTGPENITLSTTNFKNRDSSEQSEFNLKDMYIILQNVITVEDDREEIPMLCIGRDYKSLMFALV